MQLGSATRPGTSLPGPITRVLERGTRSWYSNTRESLEMLRYVTFTTQQLLEGSVFPGLNAVLNANQVVADGVVDCLAGRRNLGDLLAEATQRVKAGAKLPHLVDTVGRELFGSATWEGEEVLLEDDWYRLSYIPADPSVPAKPAALFHAGGVIPYGDRLFRLIPGSNLYVHFLKRGIPVYAMELKGDCFQNNYSTLDVDGQIDSLARMTDAAYAHGGRKLILEGYCGQGTQLLPYLAARPEDAERKIGAVAIFVAPIDGRECTLVADAPQRTPKSLTEAVQRIFSMMGGYVPGEQVRRSLDLALKVSFDKTPLGRFLAGWNQTQWAEVDDNGSLTAEQRRELAGMYWISPDNGRRFPVPIGLLSYVNKVFTEGITPRGEMPATYRGRPLSLADFKERSTIPVFGFYGGRDTVILDRTAYGFARLMGPRYTHVVHQNAGHISYVFSTSQWDPTHRSAFDPNPIDLILPVFEPEVVGVETPVAASTPAPQPVVEAVPEARKKAQPKKKTPARKKAAKPEGETKPEGKKP